VRGELSIAAEELLGASNDICRGSGGASLGEAGLSPRSVGFPTDPVVFLRDHAEFSSETIGVSGHALVLPNVDGTFPTE
jgi:hypothetical protein